MFCHCKKRELGDPVMVFRAYTKEFFGNVMDCSPSSLRKKLKNCYNQGRNDVLQQDFLKNVAVIGMAFQMSL